MTASAVNIVPVRPDIQTSHGGCTCVLTCDLTRHIAYFTVLLVRPLISRVSPRQVCLPCLLDYVEIEIQVFDCLMHMSADLLSRRLPVGMRGEGNHLSPPLGFGSDPYFKIRFKKGYICFNRP